MLSRAAFCLRAFLFSPLPPTPLCLSYCYHPLLLALLRSSTLPSDRASCIAPPSDGTYAQAISIFPKQYHAFFFIGTYSLSVCVAPFNVAVGNLDCTTGGSNHDDARWAAIEIFYACAGGFNVIGVLCFVLVGCVTSQGRAVFDAKQRDLEREHGADSDVARELEEIWEHTHSNTLFDMQLAASAPVARQIREDSDGPADEQADGGSAAAARRQTTIDSLCDGTTWVEGSSVSGDAVVLGRHPSSGGAASPDKPAAGSGASGAKVWRRCAWVGLIMAVGLVGPGPPGAVKRP